MTERVPDLILAADAPAVAAYLAFFESGDRQPNTCKLYGQHARRFFHWAGRWGFSLSQTIEEFKDLLFRTAHQRSIVRNEYSHDHFEVGFVFR